MEEHPELTPAEATKLAMREITAPIIAITLVLLSVVVPIAYINGISGELFGVFLKPHHGPRRGLIGRVMNAIDRVRDAYGAAVARIVRFSIIGLVLVGVAAFGTYGLARITPTGFLPEDDQGAFFVVVQLPGAASVERTAEVIKQAEAILKEEHAVEDVTSVVGLNFIDNYSQANAGFMVVTLKPFEERKDKSLGVNALIARLNEKFRHIQG